ncbi:unnamed protein product, partial [Effrenium voratum]
MGPVCVLFQAPAMRRMLDRYAVNDQLALAVDTKMKVANHGMGVATLSLLVKDKLRPTTLIRHGDGCRVQGRAYTSHAVPIMQAVFHDETEANYERLFRAFDKHWMESGSNRPPLTDVALQVHKDFHKAIETARRSCWPASRACDDFFHFSQKKHTTLASKCKTLEQKKGKWVKTYLKWTADALALLRLVPTLSIFSHLWKSLLFTLRESGEGIVADWLRSYERPLPPALCRAPADADQLIFASFWCGRDGCFPGTGGGSQPAEAVHAAWQTQLQKLGGKGDVSHVLGVMQRLYTESWASWYEWHADSPLHLRTTEIDPNLICGEALKRAGRTPAARFAELSPDTTFYVRTCSSTHEHWVVLVHSEAQLPLPSKMAAQLADIMVATGSRLTTLLKQANVLAGEGKLQLEAAGRMFEDLCCVMGSSLQCSCSVYAYHGQCEHSIFVASLDLTHKPATVDLKTLPQKRKGGRPKAAAEPPRKRRALAKAKAKAVAKNSARAKTTT